MDVGFESENTLDLLQTSHHSLAAFFLVVSPLAAKLAQISLDLVELRCLVSLVYFVSQELAFSVASLNKGLSPRLLNPSLFPSQDTLFEGIGRKVLKQLGPVESLPQPAAIPQTSLSQDLIGPFVQSVLPKVQPVLDQVILQFLFGHKIRSEHHS